MLASAFRRSVVGATSGRKGGGGKGGSRGNYFDKYKLPKDRDTAFMLIEAEYVDQYPDPGTAIELGSDGQPLPVRNAFYKFRNHKRRMIENGKEIYPDERCSAGADPHNPQPCVGCMAMDQGDKSVSVTNTYAFGIIHLANYHTHPLIDWKTGQVRMKTDGSGPLMVYDECRGRDCNFCRLLKGQPTIQYGKYTFPNYNPKDIGTHFGRRRYIELGKNHLEDLMSWSGLVSKFCQGTRTDASGVRTYCKSELQVESWNCHVCKSVVIDMTTDSRTDSQIEELVKRPYPCMTCKRETFLEEKLCCGVCNNAVVSSLFNRVLIGSRQGEQKNSHLVLSDHQSVENFEQSVKSHLGDRTLQQVIAELGQPYEFSEVLKPRSLEEQAKQLQLNMPNLPKPVAPNAQFGSQFNYPTVPTVPNVLGTKPLFTTYPTAPGQVPSVVPSKKPDYGV